MIPIIPFDILQLILDAVDDKQSLARCCLASKIMLDIARPRLYRSIEMVVYYEEDWTEYCEVDEPWADMYYQLLQQSSSLLDTLEGHPGHRALVQEVVLNCTRKHGKRRFTSLDGSKDVSERLIELLPTSKTFTLINPVDFSEIDTILGDLQKQHPQKITLHLVLLKPFSQAARHWHLRATYSSIRTDNGTLTLYNTVGEILPKVRSLVLECSTNMHKFSLSKFSNLERLELVSVPTSITGAVSLSNIYTTSQRLPNLKSLVISGCPSPTLDLILSPAGIVKFIPSSVVTLSLNIDIGVDKLRRIVKSLPIVTSIRVLGTRSLEGNLGELEKECEKRDVKLARA